jgi:putative ABC transport system substrate-binding protein
MRRRDFIGVIYCAAVALPCGAEAQQPGKVWRIGQVGAKPGGIYAQALEQHLAELGYVRGRNIVLLSRFVDPQPDKFQEAVISLVPQVDLLVVWGYPAIMAKKFVGGLPTVFISYSFAVEVGLVQSLAHPGGNMTGIASEAAPETYGKRLQILREIVPDLKRVAVLGQVPDPNRKFVMTALDQAARDLGLTLVTVDIKSADDLEAAIASMKKSEAEAFTVTRSNLTGNFSKQIAELALAAHLPSCHFLKEAVIAGALVSLGADLWQ